jgi:hypothetical protein
MREINPVQTVKQFNRYINEGDLEGLTSIDSQGDIIQRKSMRTGIKEQRGGRTASSPKFYPLFLPFSFQKETTTKTSAFNA